MDKTLAYPPTEEHCTTAEDWQTERIEQPDALEPISEQVVSSAELTGIFAFLGSFPCARSQAHALAVVTYAMWRDSSPYKTLADVSKAYRYGRAHGSKILRQFREATGIELEAGKPRKYRRECRRRNHQLSRKSA